MFPKGTKAQEIKRERMEDWQGKKWRYSKRESESESELGRLWKFQK